MKHAEAIAERLNYLGGIPTPSLIHQGRHQPEGND